MATCLEVVTDALHLARVIPIAREPKGAEAVKGMRCLQSLYDSWVTGGMFGRLEDVFLDADDDAQEGKRYYVSTGVTLTPATSEYFPEDETEARQPRDLAIYETVSDDGRSVQLYDRTAWVELTGLALEDEAPLSGRGAMGLSAALAVSGAFASMFGSGQGVNPDIRMLAANFLSSLSFKRGATFDRGTADYF
jgi:hypothetical protein